MKQKLKILVKVNPFSKIFWTSL